MKNAGGPELGHLLHSAFFFQAAHTVALAEFRAHDEWQMLVP